MFFIIKLQLFNLYIVNITVSCLAIFICYSIFILEILMFWCSAISIGCLIYILEILLFSVQPYIQAVQSVFWKYYCFLFSHIYRLFNLYFGYYCLLFSHVYKLIFKLTVYCYRPFQGTSFRLFNEQIDINIYHQKFENLKIGHTMSSSFE